MDVFVKLSQNDMKKFFFMYYFCLFLLAIPSVSSAKQRILILYIPSNEIIKQDQLTIYGDLYAYYSQMVQFQTVTNDELNSLFDTKPGGDDTTYQIAEEYLKNGKEYYSYLKWDDTILNLHMARDTFLGNPKMTYSDYIETHLYLGLAYLLSGNKTEAAPYLSAAIDAKPQIAQDTASFTPEILQYFEEIKKKLESHSPKTLHVETNPSGAKVFVNGQERGLSPLDLGDLYLNNYLIVVRLSGYQEGMARIEFNEEETERNLSLQLAPQVSVADLKNTYLELSKKSFQEKQDYVYLIGSLLKADFVYLTEVDLVGLTYELNVNKIDVNNKDLQPVSAKAKINLAMKDLEKPISDLARELESATMLRVVSGEDENMDSSVDEEINDDIMSQEIPLRQETWLSKWCFLGR